MGGEGGPWLSRAAAVYTFDKSPDYMRRYALLDEVRQLMSRPANPLIRLARRYARLDEIYHLTSRHANPPLLPLCGSRDKLRRLHAMLPRCEPTRPLHNPYIAPK